MLHVHVELLDLAGPEIDILRLNGSREAGRIWLRSEDRETVGKTQCRRSHVVDSRTSSGREGATGDGEGEGIGLRVQRAGLLGYDGASAVYLLNSNCRFAANFATMFHCPIH